VVLVLVALLSAGCGGTQLDEAKVMKMIKEDRKEAEQGTVVKLLKEVGEIKKEVEETVKRQKEEEAKRADDGKMRREFEKLQKETIEAAAKEGERRALEKVRQEADERKKLEERIRALEGKKDEVPDGKEAKKDVVPVMPEYVSESLKAQAKLEMDTWLRGIYGWLDMDGNRDWRMNNGPLYGMSYGMRDRFEKRLAYYRKCQIASNDYLDRIEKGLPAEKPKLSHPSNTKDPEVYAFHSRPEAVSSFFRGGEWVPPITLEEIQEKNRQKELAKKKPKL